MTVTQQLQKSIDFRRIELYDFHLRYDISGPRRVPVSVFMVKIVASEPLKRVTGRILRIISNFTEASKKLTMKYHRSKLCKILNTISAHTKNTGLIL
jgi:hypothetical protein